MDPATLALLLKGGSQAIKTGSRLLQPKFGNTAYGRQLKQIRRDGALSKGQETGIIGNVARTASRQSALANRRYMGGLINRGMQGSVSAQRGLREAEADVRRTVADTGRDIFQSEEKAKSDARMQYARGLDQDRAERRQAGVGLASTALATLANVGDRTQQQLDKAELEQKTQADASRQSYMDAVNKYGLGNTRSFMTPDGQKRYTGALDPSAPGQTVMTIDDKRSIESYAQKANIKNASSVANTFQALQDGDVDAENFIKEMNKLGINEDQILELISIISKGK
jgi:hypothetical protein